MVKCANCNEVLCFESDLLNKIDNFEYDDMIDGGYCFDIKCEKCNSVNNVWATTETQISEVDVELDLEVE
ncbi:MAG: hypothetical protein ACRDD7_16655 [Peptostreptococcaceae bacterium]